MKPDNRVPLHAQHLAEPRLNRWILRYEPAAEQDYLRYQGLRKAPLIRLCYTVAILIYLIGLFVELRIIGRPAPPGIFLMIFGGIIPACLAAIAATFLAHRRLDLHIVTLLCFGMNQFGIAWLLQQPFGDNAFPYEILQLDLMFIFMISGILFRHALPLAAAVSIYYPIRSALDGMAMDQIVEHVFAVASSFVVAMMACYLLERAQRDSWQQWTRADALAQHDDLTGLHNRRLLLSRGEHLLLQASRERIPLAMLVVDIDHFKAYNDSLGHLAGDSCLVQLAGLLRTVVRRPLDLVTRLGGEEFVILLYDCDAASAVQRAEWLRGQLEQQKIAHPAAPLGHVTACVGVTTNGGARSSLDEMFARADLALYDAKMAGRNAVAQR